MTEDIGEYSFDFKKEVDELRNSLGDRANSILFAETDVVRGTDATSQQINVKIAGHYDPDVTKAVASIIAVAAGANTCSVNIPIGAETNAGYIISLLKNENFTEMFGLENKPFLRLYTLYHETAHALIDGVAVDDDHPFRECAADAYAAIRCFQRFGWDAGNLLSMISWGHAWEAVSGATSHLTISVLDKIIADSAQRDFSKLTPEETVELAETYAKEWTPDVSVLSATRAVFGQNSTDTVITKLAETALSSSNNFIFYVGSKFLQPFLRPDGIIRDGVPFHLPEGKRQEYSALIKERASHMSLREIFNVAAVRAEPPLAELLKVSLPKGQKKFSVKV